MNGFPESNASRSSPNNGGARLDSRSVLVFPAGMPSSLTWARHASESGIRVVGASSLAHDPARPNYSEWIVLPWIGDSDFAAALNCCVQAQNIDAVFTEHPVVWRTLRDLLPKMTRTVRLEAQPWSAELSDYRAYRDIAAKFHHEPLDLVAAGRPQPLMPLPQLAALVRLFQLVPGQCNHAKLEALTAIFRWMPPGDIVEIGSLWGRSAVALAFLARHYRTGNVLCVDPWRTEELHQKIAAVDAVFDSAPMDDIFEAFRINLAPFQGVVNYSRSRSSETAAHYSSDRCFTTEDFGRTMFTGKIALLHIDGNHALEVVCQDISLWRHFVRAGGWIVFDDYCWPFGDGPRTAADEFCGTFRENLAAQFVAGGALFVQLTRAVP
jgi:cephalosporin hydroxylase